ncbi:LamG domain-containing protein [Streptomyces sp. NPDC059544]|uniref:LamG domain-containing protein n=1 Tax=Streptomyces sp. NPDC059544 TaxID=3346861 RepID=UPI00369BA838
MVLTLATVLACTGVPALAAENSAQAAAPSPSSEAERALAQAARTGKRVEIAGDRTEFGTTYANPDGATFRLEHSVVPVRVKSRDGAWVEPDATLEKRPDGTIAPKAAAVALTFSNGGDGAGLVKIAREGRSLALGWPGPLPRPTLDGDSVTYPNVLPDVDLRMTATVEGFREVLVVKTPEAAAAPELRKITFAVKAEGLRVSPTDGGGISAVDTNATEVFAAPPALMWNSSGGAAGGTRAGQATGPKTGRVESGAARHVAEPDVGNPDEPRPGDETAALPIHVGKSAISLVPDEEMLKEADASDFPLFIDPEVSWGEAERILLRSDGYRLYNFDNQDDDGGERGKGVGKCGTWGGYYCGPGYVQRLYYEFAPNNLVGKHILGATFRVTEPWAFQCDPRWVDLVRTNPISSSTTWSSRPGELDLMVDRNISAGRGSLCDPDSPDAPIDFTDNPEESNENLTATVRNFAAGRFDRLTLMLRAHDEGDPSAWKRFKNDGTLVVDYIGKPNYPTPFGFLTGKGLSCSTEIGAPGIVTDPTPQVSATVRTMVGGSPGAKLRARFKVEKQTGSTWSALPDFVYPTAGHLGTGGVAPASVPHTLEEGPLYRIQAWTRSYWPDFSNWLTSPGSVACYFKVDKTAPKPPTVNAASVYTLCAATCTPAGGPGVKGTFTFAPAAGDTNIATFQYKWSTDKSWSPASTKTSVEIAPPEAGTYYLEVRATDTAGRPGASQIVSFLVKEGDGPVGRWHFDEDSGVAVDSSTTVAQNQDNATLSAGAVRDDRGRRGEVWHDDLGQPLAQPRTDRGLQLGASGYAATAGPVLETRSAYTVAAWVRLDSKSRHMALVSQDGTRNSPFWLSYSKDLDSWYFGVKTTDADDGKMYWGNKSKVPAQVGVWTHVAGSYDPVAKRLCLYVNGVLHGASTQTSAWSAKGPMQFGRSQEAGSWRFNLDGSLDEVAVWQRVLQPAEVAKEARTLSANGLENVELVAGWNAEGASGTTFADTTSGYGRALALTDGATLEGDAIVLDGSDDAATTAGPVVDDSGSFTVTTSVQLDPAKLLTKPSGYVAQVTGQRTVDGSSWGLWFQLTGTRTELDDDGNERIVPVGFWKFGRVNKDGTTTWASSDEEAVLGAPVRLTGVFDALSEAGPVIRLYVGLSQNDDDKSYTALVGADNFAIGKGFSATNWGHFLPGRVREVRLWAGAVNGRDQLETVVGG